MSKRFTDTKIWDQAWFRKLSPRLKEAWRFLCDKCDHAGIWHIDIDAISFFVGEPVSLNEILDAFNVTVIGSKKDRLFIPGFIEFQYNCKASELNPENKVHKSVLSKLEKEGLCKDLARGSQAPKDKDKEKVKEKDNVLRNEFEKIYSEIYPLKKGKTKGISFLLKDLKPEEKPEDVKLAAQKYANDVKVSKTEKKYIKHFSTWAHEWRDWKDLNAGEGPSAKHFANERDTDFQKEIEELNG